MPSYSYALAPFVAWVVAGSLKFAINTVKAGRPAFKQIGYGGLPSTHTSIVTTVAFLVGFREGFQSAAFGIALTLAFIVVMDAISLRRRIGDHASAINLLRGDGAGKPLRESIGHKPIEVAAGIATGLAVAFALWKLPI